ncbi:MAG: bifunctional heptose 7-phosphate kinase/heptose 1-phosphate adenyltransferase [Brevinema sp.]
MLRTRLEEILSNIEDIHVGVIGDACVDIYWHADMTKSQLSRETPMFPLPIFREEFSLGAAGNTAVNIRALGAKSSLLTLIGSDWRAQIFHEQLKNKGISSQFVVEDASLVTPAYCKPMRHGISGLVYEDSRLDFANHHNYGATIQQKLLENLENMAKKSDILIVVDQLAYVVNDELKKLINHLGLQMPIFVDSRHHIRDFVNCIIKPNESEAFKALNPQQAEPLSYSVDDVVQMGHTLSKNHTQGVVITAGASGTYWFQQDQTKYVPTKPAEPPIDVVGCGDNFMACMATALAAGATTEEAMTLGNMGAGITVKKLGTTGSSSPNEILKTWEENHDVFVQHT